MMSTLAPIGLTVYSRLEHTKITVGALQKNTLAQKSKLYVFSDGAREGDEEKVQRMRAYIKTIDGFDDVVIVERDENGRLNNNRGGQRFLLNKYGKIIWLAEDIVTKPGFLQFMNDGLDYYENDEKILAINGYNVPAKYPETYRQNYYFSLFFNAWGFATWAKGGILEIMDYKDAYLEILADKKLRKKVSARHPGLIAGLKKIYNGKWDAADYNLVFHSIKTNSYSIKPIISFVNNIGHDGTGVHCGVSKKFDVDLELSNNTITFTDNMKYNPNLDTCSFRHVYMRKILTVYLLKKCLRYINIFM